MTEVKKISVVIPTFNEEKSVTQLFSETKTVLDKTGQGYEIIFVNDGSTDDTFEVLNNLSPIKVIHLRRNFGQTAALDAGIKEAQGELIVTMDADLQNDPSDIPLMVEKLEKDGLDVVAGWRKKRQDPVLKKVISRGANLLRKILINDGIHDSGCTLKVFKRDCFVGVDLHGEMHRFIPAILKIKGYKIGEIEVKHRPRQFGTTKYTWYRTIKGFLDMFSLWFWKKYASRPLHFFGSLGIFLIALALVSDVYLVYIKFFLNRDLSNTVLTTLSLFSFLMGVQFVIFGLVADMISKIYYASGKDKAYEIKEIVKK